MREPPWLHGRGGRDVRQSTAVQPGQCMRDHPAAPRSVDVSIMVAILASFRIAQYRTAFMRALTDERSNARGGVWRSPGPVAGNDDMGANDSADADGKCHNSNEDDTIGRMSETNNDNLWPAPTADGPLNATVTIPGSKSLSNRYLILAVLGAKPVTLVGLLRSRDTELMMGALSALGVRCDIDPENDTTVTVTPPESGRFSGNVGVYCGLAGTVMRFVPGLALFADARCGSMETIRHTRGRCSRFSTGSNSSAPASNTTASTAGYRSPSRHRVMMVNGPMTVPLPPR